MKLNVDKEAHALYPRLDDSPIVESEAISPGVVLDYNESNEVVGVKMRYSPFPATARRPMAELAAQRNDLVASLASRVFIAHAAPGSKTEAFARTLAASGKPLLTLDSPSNEKLVAMGAEMVEMEQIPKDRYTTESLTWDSSFYS